eukprot:13654055-Ditylum_brightwellii.AAC.1
MCSSTHNASNRGMSGLFLSPDGVPLVWCILFPTQWQHHLKSPANLHGNLHINILELTTHIAQLHLNGSVAHLLEQAHTDYNNFATVAWEHHGNIACHSVCTSLLCTCIFLLHLFHLTNTISFLPAVANMLAGVASHLWDLPDKTFLAYFNTLFLQKQSWQMCPLPSALRR